MVINKTVDFIRICESQLLVAIEKNPSNYNTQLITIQVTAKVSVLQLLYKIFKLFKFLHL